MAKKRIVKPNELKIIEEVYHKNKKSLEITAEKVQSLEGVPTSTAFISTVTKEYGWYRYADGTVAKPKEVILPKEGFRFVAVCKETGREIKDYDNRSGELTKHINKILPGNKIMDLSKFNKKDNITKNNEFWYLDFFDIIEKKIRNTIKCRYCQWETVDTDNKTGALPVHILSTHNITIESHLINFPEDINILG